MKLTVQKKVGRRYRMVKGLTVNGKAGLNKVALRRKAKAGRYRLVAVATDQSGNISRKFAKKLRLKK